MHGGSELKPHAHGGTIHPTAIVYPTAKVHESCEIGAYCSVGPDVFLGPGTKLLSHVVIDNKTTIGENNVFHPFSVIGGIPQDRKYQGELSELIIGDYNTVRESVTINIGTDVGGGTTRIGDHNLLMAYVHVAHDSIVGNHAVIANSCQIAGHVSIEDWVTIGGLTGVSQRVRIGAHSYIGGCSGVNRDVPPFTFGSGPTGSFEILGMNLVGLKRRNFRQEDIAALKDVHQLFFKDKSLDRQVRLTLLEERLGSAAVVKQFIEFVRTSKVGIHQ
jgi:UDP-N-acetylglucosamine acyltransferase